MGKTAEKIVSSILLFVVVGGFLALQTWLIITYPIACAIWFLFWGLIKLFKIHAEMILKIELKHNPISKLFKGMRD